VRLTQPIQLTSVFSSVVNKFLAQMRAQPTGSQHIWHEDKSYLSQQLLTCFACFWQLPYFWLHKNNQRVREAKAGFWECL
jgi:hypothetical protein